MTIQRRKAVTQCCWWSLQWKMSLQKGTMKTDGGGGGLTPIMWQSAWIVLTGSGRKDSRSLAPSVPTEPDPLAFSAWN